MAYFEKPRIVVEQSPWQTFFEKLPDLFLSFHKLKLQAEESEKEAFQSDFLWIIDPLDGTTNFVHGYPSFAVAIGLFFQNKSKPSDHFSEFELFNNN